MKSIKEKKKIQEERTQESKLPKEKSSKIPERFPIREKPQTIKPEESLEMRSFEETFPDINNVYDGIQGEIVIDRKSKRGKSTLEIEREEILKGIIYSEILSKPKSLRK
ncbi:MAG: hypothetical protein GX968_01110 [Tissierellia bacterium]|nr:hypothetical protein [Tissierellia bacterium]